MTAAKAKKMRLQTMHSAKEDVINTTLFWLALPTFLAVLSSASRAQSTGWATIYSVQAGLWLVATIVYLFRGKIPTSLKALIIAVLSYIVVVSGYVAHGNTSASGPFIVLGAVILTVTGGFLQGGTYVGLVILSLAVAAFNWLTKSPVGGTNTATAWSYDIFLYAIVSMIGAYTAAWSFKRLGRLGQNLGRELKRAEKIRSEMAARLTRQQHVGSETDELKTPQHILPCWAGVRRKLQQELPDEFHGVGLFLKIANADRLRQVHGNDVLNHLLYTWSQRIGAEGYAVDKCGEAAPGAMIILLEDISPNFVEKTAEDIQQHLNGKAVLGENIENLETVIVYFTDIRSSFFEAETVEGLQNRADQAMLNGEKIVSAEALNY